MKVSFQLNFDTDKGTFEVINTETGEAKTVEVAKKKTTSRKKKEEATDPQIILEDNKYSINTAARELMQIEEGAKVLIKFKKVGKDQVPVIGTEEAFGVTGGGNKLCKNNTVACRGKANTMLAEYGTVFTLTENVQDPGTFFLNGDKVKVDIPEEFDQEVVDEAAEYLNGLTDDLSDAEKITADEFDNFLNNI